MTLLAGPFLAPWAPYFTMTATAGATLIGLMFVVVTLVTRAQGSSDAGAGLSTFSTPTVIHFGAVLLVSGILIAPWPRIGGVFALVTLLGLAGFIHMVRVAALARKLTEYDPDAEDWTWYTVLPFIAYSGLLAGGIVLPFGPRIAPWILGAAVMLLIFIGIRNSWDVVTYLAISRAQPDSDDD
jgi:hypothetical protein